MDNNYFSFTTLNCREHVNNRDQQTNMFYELLENLNNFIIKNKSNVNIRLM